MAEFAPAMPMAFEQGSEAINLVAEMRNNEQEPAQADVRPEEERTSIRKRVMNSPLARKVVAGAAALTLVGGAAETAQAAETTPVKFTESTTFQISVAGSKMSDSAYSKATVMGNYRTISKKRLAKAEKNGDCYVLDGKKTKIWTQGHTENGHPYGVDTRTSTFCDEYKTVIVNGHKTRVKHTYRKECGNAAVTHRPEQVVEKPIWVKNLNNVNVSVKAKASATAEADCKTANTSAHAYGHGEASAISSIRFRNRAQIKAKEADLKVSASASARAKAGAKAVVACAELKSSSTATTTPTPEQDVCKNIEGNQAQVPANYYAENGNCYPSKDGTTGAGAGTTGTTNTGSTVGGPGAGGAPGNTANYSVACYDSADNQNGDLNAATTGETMYTDSTIKVDQFGYCIGKAQAAVSA